MNSTLELSVTMQYTQYTHIHAVIHVYLAWSMVLQCMQRNPLKTIGAIVFLQAR